MAIKNLSDEILKNEDRAGALRGKIWRLQSGERAHLHKLGVSDRDDNFSEATKEKIAGLQLELDCVKEILIGQRAMQAVPPVSAADLVGA